MRRSPRPTAWPRKRARRRRPIATCAICAACCGRRSTTTTRWISISCRSQRRCRRARPGSSSRSPTSTARCVRDRRSTITRAPTRRRFTPPRRSSRCCPRSCRPISRRSTRARNARRSSSRCRSMTTDRSRTGSSIARWSSTARSSPTTAWRPGSTVRPRRRPRCRRSRGWPTTCACRIASRRRCGGGDTSAARWSWRRWSRARCSTATR